MNQYIRDPELPPKRRPPGFLVVSVGTLIILFIFSLLMDLKSKENNVADPSSTPLVLDTATPSPLPTITFTAPSTPTSTPTSKPTSTPTSTPEPTFTIEPTPTRQFGESFIIGYSVEDRPLEVYQFGNGPRERMIVAGIHGGYEWNTVALAEELIAYLTENPELVPAEVTLYFLKNMNPDGYAKAWDATGRANANGVDLNRNFDADWLIDWNRDVCFNQVYVTAGPEPGSEPETQAFMAFVLSHNLEALISYHSAGLGIFPGGVPPGPKSQMLAYYLSGLSPYAYPPKDIGCVYSGMLANWMVLQGVPAVDVELSTHGNTDFEINKRILEFFLKPDLELGG